MQSGHDQLTVHHLQATLDTTRLHLVLHSPTEIKKTHILCTYLQTIYNQYTIFTLFTQNIFTKKTLFTLNYIFTKITLLTK